MYEQLHPHFGEVAGLSVVVGLQVLYYTAAEALWEGGRVDRGGSGQRYPTAACLPKSSLSSASFSFLSSHLLTPRAWRERYCLHATGQRNRWKAIVAACY